jgi:uncharacterized protein (DUF952 family)
MHSIYHIAATEEWRRAQTDGIYRVESLEIEGFIHCSTVDQVVAVADRFYHGRTDLILLQIDADRLTAPLRYDEVEPGMRFPHLYGPLNLAAVQAVFAFHPGPDGGFGLPAELTR